MSAKTEKRRKRRDSEPREEGGAPRPAPARPPRAPRFIAFHVGMGILTAILTTAVLTTGKSPKVGLGGWCSDHYSHVFATVLFLSNGFDIYRKPVADLCSSAPDLAPRTAEAASALDVNPADICWPRDRAPDRPLVVNWQRHPRPYPPGHLLYFLPEALAYEHLGVGFATVNALVIAKLAVVAHLAFVVATLLLAGFRPRGVAYLLGALAYSHLMSLALAGIYDGLALLGVFLAMLQAKRDRPFAALLALGAAFFFHFRVLWLAPLGVYVAVRAFRARRALAARLFPPAGEGKGIALAAWVGAVLAVFCFASAAAAFFTLLPALERFPLRSDVYFERLSSTEPAAVGYLVTTLGIALLLAARRRWLALAAVAWCSILFVRTPQIQTWHSHMLLPVLLLPVLEEEGERRVESAFALLVWFSMALRLVFKTSAWPDWLADVAARISGG